MNARAYVVEVRVNGVWRPAQRADKDYPTEIDAINAAKEAYPITVYIQANNGPVGIRVVEVVMAQA